VGVVRCGPGDQASICRVGRQPVQICALAAPSRLSSFLAGPGHPAGKQRVKADQAPPSHPALPGVGRPGPAPKSPKLSPRQGRFTWFVKASQLGAHFRLRPQLAGVLAGGVHCQPDALSKGQKRPLRLASTRRAFRRVLRTGLTASYKAEGHAQALGDGPGSGWIGRGRVFRATRRDPCHGFTSGISWSSILVHVGPGPPAPKGAETLEGQQR